MSDAPYDLPDGWTWKKLRQVVEIKYGDGLRAQDRKGGEVLVFGSNGEIGRHNSAITSGKTIIIGRKGSVGEVHFSESACWPIDTTYFVDQFPNDTDARFLFHFLRNQDLPHLDRSTAVPGINRNDLYDVDIPFPPLPEQQRIVARIESLFAESHTARDALERVPALLKQFRQSVLASAFRGELTERGNQEISEVLETSEILTAAALPELPEGWTRTTIGEVCTVNPTMQWPEGFTKNKPVHFVPMSAVDGEMGAIVSPEPRPISEVWKGYKRFQDGDVIFARITPCMENGKAAIAKNLLNGIGLGSTEYHVLRPSEKILAEWIYHFVRQQSFRNEAARAMTGTAGQLRVPADFVIQAEIPLPPLAEQRRIVAKIESLFAQADAIEHAVAIARQRADKIDQSILARAFHGEL